MADSSQYKPYSYADAGFSNFFTRSIGSLNSQPNLPSLASSVSQTTQTINFDQQQTSGSMGDKFTVGRIIVDGTLGRISINDDKNQNEVVRLGNIKNA